MPAPSSYSSGRDDNDLYPFNRLEFDSNDVSNRCDGIVEPLSLFAPYPHEDWNLVRFGYDPEEEEDNANNSEVDLERPVTPIDEEIAQPPTSYLKLAKLVRRRITAKNDYGILESDDQKELAAIIMGEVNGIWADYRVQVDDPFLSIDENKELQRRITVHIVTVCEQLFKHYLEKAQILQRRGVFSGPANMSRLKAQLSLDTNKFLNIQTIRRYIIEDMRQGSMKPSAGRKKPPVPGASVPGLSYKGLIAASRPRSKTKRFEATAPADEIKDMTKEMPTLDTARLERLKPDFDQQECTTVVDDEKDQTTGSYLDSQSAGLTSSVNLSSGINLDDDTGPHIQRSHSVPLLDNVDKLTEACGLESRHPSALSLIDEQPLCTDRNMHSEDIGALPGTREYAAEDLQRLVRRQVEEKREEKEDEDLAPLLQAVTRGRQHDGCMEIFEQQSKELDEREQERKESEKLIIEEGTKPQPATVLSKLPNQMVVCTSDIRVSERVCLSSITLKTHDTVYNDIIDEIDPVTVKALDSNLFLGDEITEVYREIMKTVPTDHMLLENDPLIEPTADAIDLTSVLASATLLKKPSERLINPKLKQRNIPPWKQQAARDWSKTPQSPPKDLRGRTLIMPMTPKGDGRSQSDFFGDGYVPPSQVKAEDMNEYMARSYASWLQWWKNTLNTDDYMKYASTQETDFMGVVFHFYNSEDEDEDEDEESSAIKQKRSKQLMEEQKAQQLEALKNAKAEYKDGFWNVNSVLLGGLGNDPTLPDEVVEKRSITPAEETNATKPGQNRTHLVSRKVLRANNGAINSALIKAKEVAFSPSLSRPGTKISAPLSSLQEKKEEVEEETPQGRLEKVWAALRMPDNMRLDMAIKYSSDDHHTQLEDAIVAWEKVTADILKREDLVGKLEKFERLASDPNRFFERGFRGSSIARLEEARIRSTYYKKIDKLDSDIRDMLVGVQNDFNDTVSYQGRPYLDKLQWDRTEMLYWLQEERKQQALDYESRIKHLPPLPLKLTQLNPAVSAPVI